MKLKVILSVFLITAISSDSAQALFGSECRKPKQSLETTKKQISKLNSEKSAELKNYQAARRAQIESWQNIDCSNKSELKLANQERGTKLSELSCEFAQSRFILPKQFSKQSKIFRLQSVRNQILVTYSKCFDPTQVAKAKIALNR